MVFRRRNIQGIITICVDCIVAMGHWIRKEATSHDDLLDVFRNSLMFWQ